MKNLVMNKCHEICSCFLFARAYIVSQASAQKFQFWVLLSLYVTARHNLGFILHIRRFNAP